MGIVKIDIENYKSIKKCTIDMNELNIIIGENRMWKNQYYFCNKVFL